jgi:pimeloyl-ACP methyl ester carboxylesterase
MRLAPYGGPVSSVARSPARCYETDMEPIFLSLPDGRRIAYSRREGRGPGVVFLGGFRSDMNGTKAAHLEDWAATQGRAFLRFDYTGHGASSGDFEDGCIGDWARDAGDALTCLTEGPQILVGSSMGGWIAFLLARRFGLRVAGIVAIAAAPDFTEDTMWAGFDERQRNLLLTHERVVTPTEYSDEPYVITRRLIEDGRHQLVLRSALELKAPVRLLHGTADADVDVSVALRLLSHAQGPDIRLTLVKGADHRFSSSENLDLITGTIADISLKK